MKKILFIIVGLLFIVGCSNKVVTKTEYNINEEANIDNLKIKLIEANYTEDNNLQLIFDITSDRDNSFALVADDYFKLYDINKVQIPNNYTSNKTIIKKNETIKYIVQYNINKKKMYDIYFYTGVVDNNVLFKVTTMNINK